MQTHHIDQKIDQRRHSSVREYAQNCSENRHACKANSDDVEHDHGQAGHSHRLLCILDLVGPVYILQCNPTREVLLDDLGRLKMEAHGSVGAFCDVFAPMVCRGVGRIIALAKVHQMNFEEVGEVQGFGDVRGHITDQVVDVSLDVVDETVKK